MNFERVRAHLTIPQTVPRFVHSSEYEALEDEEVRWAAFFKFVKRQKDRLREKEISEDGGSTTSRRRKEPTKDKEDKKKTARIKGQGSRP